MDLGGSLAAVMRKTEKFLVLELADNSAVTSSVLCFLVLVLVALGKNTRTCS